MTTRRRFIKDITGATLACCGLGLTTALWQGCTPPRYVQFIRSADRLTVQKTDFLEDKYVLITDRYLDAPVFILKKGEDEYSASLLLCTHKGCDVRPAGSILVCPCHGSEFSREGAVLKGPAEEPLHTYPVTTDHEKIFIHLI